MSSRFALITLQTPDLTRPKTLLISKEGKAHHGEDPRHHSAGLLQQGAGSLDRSSRGDQVVHHQNTSPGGDILPVNLNGVLAVLEIEGPAQGIPGELALLSQQDQGDSQTVREWSGQQKPSSLDGGYSIQPGITVGLHHAIQGMAERIGVSQKAGEIIEENSRLGEILNPSNCPVNDCIVTHGR